MIMILTRISCGSFSFYCGSFTAFHVNSAYRGYYFRHFSCFRGKYFPKLASSCMKFKLISGSFDIPLWLPGRFLCDCPLSMNASINGIDTVGIRNFSDHSPGGRRKIRFSFESKDMGIVWVEAFEGENLLEIAHQNEILLEGACDGQCSCSTCHVILDEELYEQLGEPSEQEEDMLDLAACLTDTSRLGCQVRVDKNFEGRAIKVPNITRNFYVDGYKPMPH